MKRRGQREQERKGEVRQLHTRKLRFMLACFIPPFLKNEPQKGAFKFICFTETLPLSLCRVSHGVLLRASHFKTTLIRNVVTFQTRETLITLFKAHMSSAALRNLSAAMTNGGRERFIYLLCVKETRMRPKTAALRSALCSPSS